MIRKILGIVAGYAIFAVTSLALFKLSGQDPHTKATTLFVILTAIYGAVFSFVAGLVAPVIARTGDLKINYILGFIILRSGNAGIRGIPEHRSTQFPSRLKSAINGCHIP
jgi:hypothetical protein